MGADFSPSSSYQCSTWSDRVLEVRALEYDDTGRPVLLDASWVGRCAYGTVSRVEVRLGVDTPVVLPKADPDRVGQLRTYAGRPLTRTVTVTNPGPNALTLGQATTRGDAAADWSVVGNGCQAVQLLAGETCDVTVQFAFTRAGARPAALEVAAEDAAGALAPVTVPLDGFGTTPPLSELMGTLTPSIHAMLGLLEQAVRRRRRAGHVLRGRAPGRRWSVDPGGGRGRHRRSLPTGLRRRGARCRAPLLLPGPGPATRPAPAPGTTWSSATERSPSGVWW